MDLIEQEIKDLNRWKELLTERVEERKKVMVGASQVREAAAMFVFLEEYERAIQSVKLDALLAENSRRIAEEAKKAEEDAKPKYGLRLLKVSEMN